MSTDILISSDPWENRVAILEDGRLAEIYVEREERVIGSIYKGKVVNVLPGMGASFCDIGLGRNAFLYVDDINKTPLNIGDVEVMEGRSGYTITEKVSRGDDVLVQIVKEPRGLKGARVSTNISLPGRYLILMPTGKFSGVSRKIESADERNRLKTIMKAIRPEGMATVVRTAAANVSNAELIADLGLLIRMWHGILEQYKRVPAPALLHKDMNLVYKTARDFITPDVEHVWLDDQTETDNVKDFMRLLGPQYVDRIGYYEHGKRLFGDFKIDDEINRLMKPTCKLPSGGSIVIETTEALTVIDINSGKFTGGKNLDDTIVRTNIEAAAEIARQVRLRDIGGIIICDFIDMSSESDRNKVIATLQEGLRKDRTRSTIQSFSPLGLLEFTRKRVGKDLGQQLRGKCPTCEGLGSVMSPESVTIGTFRDIIAHKNGTAKHVHIAAAPSVAVQADYWYENEREALGQQLGTQIDVFVDSSVHPERPRIVWGDDAMPTLAPIRVGDEFEVELLHTRLPNASSAAAVVAGRIVEVENAVNAVGKTIKIKVLDVDGGEILAEPRTPVETAIAIGEGTKKKRRRGGRARKGGREMTPAEQAEELRELAEEAERGLGGRTSIGISTEEEVAAKNIAPKTTAQKAAAGKTALLAPSALAAPSVAATNAAPPSFTNGGGTVTQMPGESLSGARIGGMLPGEKLSGDRVVASGGPAPTQQREPREPREGRQPRRPMPAAAPAPAARAGGNANAAPSENVELDENGNPKRRRRRRRRGRGGAGEGATNGTFAGVVEQQGRVSLDADATEDDGDEDASAPVTVDGAAPEAIGENGERKRRRRRRRRRGGRGGANADGTAVAAGESTQQPPLPDRHIFRVDSEGGAQATGETAPQQPSRAIAPWNRKRGDIAVSAPPPVMTVPAENVKTARPSRRPRPAAATAAPARGGSISAAAPVRALPSTAGDGPTVDTTAAARRGGRRKPASDTATTVAPAAAASASAASSAGADAPKRGRSPRAVAGSSAETAQSSGAAVTKTAAAKAASTPTKAPSATKAPAAKKATTRKAAAPKVTAAKAPAAKATAVKAPAAAKKSSGTRAASTAKKATTTRKKS